MTRRRFRGSHPCAAALALGAALAPFCPGPARAEARFAMAIASNLGLGTDTPLAWADRDAERFLEVLGEMGAVSDDRRVLIQGADSLAMERAFARLYGRVEEARRAGERTVVFILYSGHADEETLHVRGSRVPMRRFRELVGAVPAHATVTFVDACHAGKLVRGRSKGLTDAPPFEISFSRDIGPEGRVIIASAGAGEVAQESDALGASYFLHHLVSALRGGADADHDGRVTLSETYRYVYARTVTSSHATIAATQHPALETALAGEGEIVLSQLERAQSHIELATTLFGNLLVLSAPQGDVVAEVEKRPGDHVSLALPAGRYRVQVRRDSDLLVGEVALPWGGSETLAPEDLATSPLYAATARDGAGLVDTWAMSASTGLGTSAMSVHTRAYELAARMARSVGPHQEVSVGAHVSQSRGTGSHWQIGTHELALTPAVGGSLAFGPLSVVGRGGLGIMAIEQNLTRREAARLAIVSAGPTEERRWSLAATAEAGVALRLAVTGRWFAVLESEGRLLIIHTDTGRTVRPELAVRTGAGAFL